MDIRNAKVAKEILKIGRIYQLATAPVGDPLRWLEYRGFRSGEIHDMIIDEKGELECLSGAFGERFGTYIFVTKSGMIVEFESLDLVEPWK